MASAFVFHALWDPSLREWGLVITSSQFPFMKLKKQLDFHKSSVPGKAGRTGNLALSSWENSVPRT